MEWNGMETDLHKGFKMIPVSTYRNDVTKTAVQWTGQTYSGRNRWTLTEKIFCSPVGKKSDVYYRDNEVDDDDNTCARV